jgi:hypothetical protein
MASCFLALLYWWTDTGVDGQLELPLNPNSSLTDPPSCTPSAVEDLINMLPAVLVGCLKVLELLAKVFDV